MKLPSSRLIYNRIKNVYNIKNDVALAAFLGIAQSTLSSRLARNIIDWDNIIENCDEISLDWLLTEQGNIFRNSSKNMEEITFLRDKISLLEDKIKDKEDLLKEKDRIISMLSEKTSHNTEDEQFRVG